MNIFNRNEKTVEIDMSNILIHEVKYKDERYICTLNGRYEDRIKSRFRKNIQISTTNNRTYIIAEKCNLELHEFIIRVNKILKKLRKVGLITKYKANR